MNRRVVFKFAFSIFFFFVIAVKGFSSDGGFLIKNDADKAIIPFQYIDNFIVLPVRFNHGEVMNIILDTGIRSIVLFNKKLAYKNGFFEDRPVTFAGAGFSNTVKGFVTNDVTVSLPQVQGKGISIVTLNRAFSKIRSLGIDGAMGYQIFSRFVVEIDYKNKYLILHNDKRFRLEQGYNTIPLQIEDTRPYIHGATNNEGNHFNLKLLIDTGFNDQMMLFENKKTMPIIDRLDKKAHVNSLGKGLAGTIKGRLASNFNFQIENIPINIPRLFLPRSDNYDLDDQRDGVIGNKLLSQHVVIIDYIHGHLHLRPHYYRNSLQQIYSALANSWL